MKIFPFLIKAIKNRRDGYHFASKYWQDYKKTLLPVPVNLIEVLVGIILGDATVFKQSKEAGVKFEQGYKQHSFMEHLFILFSVYRFMDLLGVRMEPANSTRAGLIKSYWFKTFSHPSFTTLYNLFYVNGVKVIRPGLVLEHVTAVSLAYLVMSDGSLNGNTLTLHTQSFTQAENLIFSQELNAKFGFSSKVVSHKSYWVVVFPSSDGHKLQTILEPYIIPSMLYKLPKK